MEVDSNHRSNLQQIYSLSPLATRESIHVKWDLQGSNLWPSACKADALPAELRSHIHMSAAASTYALSQPTWLLYT